MGKWGAEGCGDGQFNRPSGLVFDNDNNLYLVDSGNHRVQIFTGNGGFLGKFGTFGADDGELNMPWGITLDRNQNVYLADWRNDRIQKFNRDGQFLAKFGASGNMAGQFNRPTGVAVDADGDIYVADYQNHRVQVFTPEFRYVTEFIGDATLSKWAKEKLRANPGRARQYFLMRDQGPSRRFWYPSAVEVDPQGRIIVVDSCRHRLQVYNKQVM